VEFVPSDLAEPETPEQEVEKSIMRTASLFD
jgi:hypothetical protein